MTRRTWIGALALLPMTALLCATQPGTCEVNSETFTAPFDAEEGDTLSYEVIIEIQAHDPETQPEGGLALFLVKEHASENGRENCPVVRGSIRTVDPCGNEEWSADIEWTCYVNHAARFSVSAEGSACDDDSGVQCVLDDGHCELTYIVEYTSLEPGWAELEAELRADVRAYTPCSEEDMSVRVTTRLLDEG